MPFLRDINTTIKVLDSLGAQVEGTVTTGNAASTPTYTPSTGITDLAGNAMVGTAFTTAPGAVCATMAQKC